MSDRYARALKIGDDGKVTVDSNGIVPVGGWPTGVSAGYLLTYWGLTFLPKKRRAPRIQGGGKTADPGGTDVGGRGNFGAVFQDSATPTPRLVLINETGIYPAIEVNGLVELDPAADFDDIVFGGLFGAGMLSGALDYVRKNTPDTISARHIYTGGWSCGTTSRSCFLPSTAGNYLTFSIGSPPFSERVRLRADGDASTTYALEVLSGGFYCLARARFNGEVQIDGALTLAAQVANRALMGPASGGDAVPTFRAFVAADLPDATGSAKGAVVLAGQLGGTAASPDVRGLRETSGPTLLTAGAVGDKGMLYRSGSNLIGSEAATSSGTGVRLGAATAHTGTNSLGGSSLNVDRYLTALSGLMVGSLGAELAAFGATIATVPYGAFLVGSWTFYTSTAMSLLAGTTMTLTSTGGTSDIALTPGRNVNVTQGKLQMGGSDTLLANREYLPRQTTSPSVNGALVVDFGNNKLVIKDTSGVDHDINFDT